MPNNLDRDEEALALRDVGSPFVGIALVLGLDDARAANAAFNHAQAPDARRTGVAP